MHNDDSAPMSRAKLQLHVNAAIDDVMGSLNIPYDAKHRARLVRCLLRRAVRELLSDIGTVSPKDVFRSLVAVVQDVVGSMAKDGELQVAMPPSAHVN